MHLAHCCTLPLLDILQAHKARHLGTEQVSSSVGLVQGITGSAEPVQIISLVHIIVSLHECMRRTKYLGEGSAACGMGLIMGVFILVIQKYLSEDAVHNLLTFNPADFFVCVPGQR